MRLNLLEKCKASWEKASICWKVENKLWLGVAFLLGVFVGGIISAFLFNASNLIPIIASLTGVVLGWVLNQLTNYINGRPALEFRLSELRVTDTDDDPSLRVKTSLSGEVIKIYNIGKRAVVLERISLMRNGHLMVDCFLADDQQIVEPYKTVEYQFMEQDRVALQEYCDKDPFKVCDVVAQEVNGNTIVGKIDTAMFFQHARAVESIRTNENIR